MPIRRPKFKKREKKSLFPRKRVCRLCLNRAKFVDYKDLKVLEAFIRERGKLVSSRISGNCAKHQRMLVEAVKKARFLSLLPYLRY